MWALNVYINWFNTAIGRLQVLVYNDDDDDNDDNDPHNKGYVSAKLNCWERLPLEWKFTCKVNAYPAMLQKQLFHHDYFQMGLSNLSTKKLQRGKPFA